MIKRGDKVIIAIGDSFTEGQGAYDDGIWETLDWMEPTKQSVINTFTEMERNNSWPSQLKKNHLKDYNIINLGNRGKGNRNAVKKLTTFSPQFDATLASEITIVFSFTQFCRFEFIAPDTDLGPGNLFETIWPQDPDFDDKDRLGHKDLWRGYGTAIFNDKSARPTVCVSYITDNSTKNAIIVATRTASTATNCMFRIAEFIIRIVSDF